MDGPVVSVSGQKTIISVREKTMALDLLEHIRR